MRTANQIKQDLAADFIELPNYSTSFASAYNNVVGVYPPPHYRQEIFNILMKELAKHRKQIDAFAETKPTTKMGKVVRVLAKILSTIDGPRLANYILTSNQKLHNR